MEMPRTPLFCGASPQDMARAVEVYPGGQGWLIHLVDRAAGD